MINSSNGIHKEISSAIYRYLKYDDQLAFQINGPWGTGKTYYITHTIFHKMEHNNYGIKYIPIYTSLNGINTLSNLKHQLGLNLISNCFSHKDNYKRLGFTILSLFGNSLDELIENNKYLKILNGLNINPEKIGKVIRYTLLNHKNNTVLVFDDLERSDLSLSIIFGFISNLIDKFHCKIIIISNESKCNTGDKLFLHTQKEKIIGKSIQFGNDSWRIALNILKDKINDNDNLKSWILLTSKDVFKHMQSNINLRALLSIINDYKILFANITHMHISKDLMNKSLKVGYLTIFTLTDLIKKGKLSNKNDEKKKILRSIFNRTGYDLQENANHEAIFGNNYLYKTFFKNYNNKNFLENILYTCDIYKLITEDICSFKRFVKQIKIQFFSNKSIIAWELMVLTHWGTHFPDKNISKRNVKLYNAIKLINWNNITLNYWIKYYSSLIKLRNQGFLFNFKEALLYKLKNYIIIKAQNIPLNKINIFSPNTFSHKTNPKLKTKLIQIYKKRSKDKILYYAKKYLEGLLYNGISENGMINYPKFENIFLHNSFCNIILTNQRFKSMLANENHPKFTANLNEYIKEEMNHQNLYKRHHIELKYLKSLILFLDKAKSKTNSHVLTFNLTMLITSIKHFQEKLFLMKHENQLN